jgi:hypothetical protein
VGKEYAMVQGLLMVRKFNAGAFFGQMERRDATGACEHLHKKHAIDKISCNKDEHAYKEHACTVTQRPRRNRAAW